MKKIRFGYDESGKKIYEDAEGYYYDKSGMCLRVFPLTQFDKWDFENKKYIPGTPIFDTKKYKKEIETYKFQVLETGFTFDGHIQKCRDKDLALLSNAISALEDSGEVEGLLWAFSDNDIIKMSLNQLKQMRIVGMSFITTVYGIEALLKQSEVDLNLNLEKFKKMINENSEAKAA